MQAEATIRLLNLPLAGEGCITPPPLLANFLNNLKMGAVIGAKLTVPIQHRFDTFTQTFSEICRIRFEKMAFIDVMSRDFWSKNGQHSSTSRMQSFEAKRKK